MITLYDERIEIKAFIHYQIKAKHLSTEKEDYNTSIMAIQTSTRTSKV